MRILLLIVAISVFILGCNKLPWSHTKKNESYSKEFKSKGEVKNKSRESRIIQDAQIALMNAGYYKGPVDGKSSHALRKSIKRFQEDNGLMPNGELDKETKLRIKGLQDEKNSYH